MILVGKEIFFFAIVWFFTRVIILEFKHADALRASRSAFRSAVSLGDIIELFCRLIVICFISLRIQYIYCLSVAS